MFNALIRFSLANRAAVLFISLVLAIWGWVSFRGLTVEAFPDPTDTQVNVITLYAGQSAEDVERQLGLPLERALNGTPGLSRLRSLSLFGLSFVTLTFNDGVDALAARAQVLERLRGAELPEGVSPSWARWRRQSARFIATRSRGPGAIRCPCARCKTGWSALPCFAWTVWPTWSVTADC